jgi:hypothetical protein
MNTDVTRADAWNVVLFVHFVANIVVSLVADY